MEEKIYQMIVEKLGKTSLSERTIKSKAIRVANKLESGDGITDALIEDVVDDLREMDGNYSHDLALAKANLEKATAKKVVNKEVTPTSNEDEYAKKISELEAWKSQMEQRYAEAEKRQKDETYRRDVKNALKDSCTNESILRLATYDVGIDTEKSVEENVRAIREQYDKEIAAGIKAGIFPQESLNASVTPLTDEQIAERAKEEKKLLTNF